MTLSVGNRVAKIAQTWNQETNTWDFDEPSRLVEAEMYREFEILAVGPQGIEPFYILAKLIK